MAAKPQQPIPAATFGRNFGLYREMAIARGRIEVSNNGRPAGAYLSQEEYEKFKELKRKENCQKQ